MAEQVFDPWPDRDQEDEVADDVRPAAVRDIDVNESTGQGCPVCRQTALSSQGRKPSVMEACSIPAGSS